MPTIHVHLLPLLVAPDAVRGGVAIMIDLLRASTTMLRALDVGASAVHPCLEPDEARHRRGVLIDQGVPPESIVLGGERGGVRIPGFDLGNAPSEYTSTSVGGREVVFTTTNGTRALLAARDGGAAVVLIGCLNNVSAVVVRAAGLSQASARPVHIICAGTNGEVSQEDVLCAGAVVHGLLARGLVHGSDDQGRIARDLWMSTRDRGGSGIVEALRASRGGRNLLRLGFDGDIVDCAAVDTSKSVPSVHQDGIIRSETMP